MMTTKLTRILVFSMNCCLAVGCASTPTHFYVLESVHDDAKITEKSDRNVTVGLGPVEIPQLLDRSQIVTKDLNNQVSLAEFNQWGEPLDANITQVLAGNLTAMRDNMIIRPYPWSAFGDVDYRIVVRVLKFEPDPERVVILQADWTIFDNGDRRVLENGHSTIRLPAEDQSYAGMVKSMSRTLGSLSLELSSSLDRVIR